LEAERDTTGRRSMMLVRDVMQPKPIAVNPKTSVPEAIRLARERGIRHLPVVDDTVLVGIVSDRDLKRAMVSPATGPTGGEVLSFLLDRVTVDQIMTQTVITIGDMFPVEEAARLMVQEKISALPVTEGGRLIGIITETDILDLFVRAMGVSEPSSRLDVVPPEEGGSLGPDGAFE
jgi:acetoin utilization protein AcuB